MKYTFITTVSYGYLFGINANLNSNKYFNTNADYHILYHPSVTKEYRDICSKSFPFRVVWKLMEEGNFFNAKYKLACELKDEYDAICILDGDLFICSDVKEYFEKVSNSNILVTGTDMHVGGNVDEVPWGDELKIRDRMDCILADNPVFFNPKINEQFINDWWKFSFDGPHQYPWRNHPLGAYNRSVVKNIKKEQVIPLHGYYWLADSRFWAIGYDRKGDLMFDSEGQRIYAIHNRWWQQGRAYSELKANINANQENLYRGEHNFNEIKEYMEWFNDMTPETKADCYVKGKILISDIKNECK